MLLITVHLNFHVRPLPRSLLVGLLGAMRPGRNKDKDEYRRRDTDNPL